MQKFFLPLQKYEFDQNTWKNNVSFGCPPSAGHTFKNLKQEFDENSLINHVPVVIWNLPIRNERLEQFKEKTRKDPILQTLIIKYTIEGWWEKSLISQELHPYFTHRGDILP